MPKKRITVTIDEPTAEYLSDVPNVSAVVCEAVREYAAKELEIELDAAYREDAAENAVINAEWEPADAEVDE
jgi:predicted transposase YbfD/YdcC